MSLSSAFHAGSRTSLSRQPSFLTRDIKPRFHGGGRATERGADILTNCRLTAARSAEPGMRGRFVALRQRYSARNSSSGVIFFLLRPLSFLSRSTGRLRFARLTIVSRKITDLVKFLVLRDVFLVSFAKCIFLYGNIILFQSNFILSSRNRMFHFVFLYTYCTRRKALLCRQNWCHNWGESS